MALDGLLTLGAGIVGGIAGFFVAGPQGAAIGFSIGASIGAGFEDKPGVETGRIADLRVTGSSYGDPISRVYGTCSAPGSMIWTSDLIEKSSTKKEGGGLFSSGTEVTTYRYKMDLAILACEGPVEGIARLWANGELVLNLRADAGAQEITTDSGPWDSITFYTGSETQLPDPLIESYEGVGNVSALRGMAYFVIKGLKVKKFFNKAPNWKIEIVKDSTTSSPPTIVNAYSSTNTLSGRNAGRYDQGTIITGRIDTAGLNDNYQFDHYVERFDLFGNLLESEKFEVREASTSSSGEQHICANDPYFALHFNIQAPGSQLRLYYRGEQVSILSSGSGPLDTEDYEAYGRDQQRTIKRRKNGLIYWVTVAGNAKGLIRYTSVDDKPTFNSDKSRYFNDIAAAGGTSETPGNNVNHWIYPDAENEDRLFWLYTQAGVSDEYYITYLDLDFQELAHWGKSTTNIPIDDQMSRNFLIGEGYCLKKRSNVSAIIDLHTFDAATDNSDWTRDSVTGEGSSNNSAVVPLGTWGVATLDEIVTRVGLITPAGQSLQSIVEAIHADAGYDAADYDLSGLTGTVKGFRIPGPASGRDSIQQLQLTNYFDLIEADYQIQGVMRGGSSVATITADELAAHMADESMPDQVERENADSLELPRFISVTYLNDGGNYETGTQSASRQVTESNKESNVSLNVVLDDDEAMRSAHVILYNEHQNAATLRFRITEKYQKLTPADPITITDDGEAAVVRLVTINENLRGMLECSGVPEWPDVYTQIVNGSPSSTPYDEAVALNGPARLLWLDIPILNNLDDYAGVYAGASGYLATWTGHDFYQLDPITNKFENLLATFTESGRGGVATDALADFTGGGIDYENTVTVYLSNPGDSLTSAAESDVVTSGYINRCALKSGDYWEIFQFITATDNGDGTWTLSGLIRARNGTNYATAGHAAGDTFAQIDSDVYIRLKYLDSDIGTSISHKLIGKDQVAEDVETLGLAFQGVALLPFAPALVEAALSGSDWVVDWIPRTRYTPGIVNNQARGDDPEIASYTVDFLNGSTVVRSETVAVGTETYTYTAAQQTTDFGSTQSDIVVIVYQKGDTLATEGHGLQLDTSTETLSIVDPK